MDYNQTNSNDNDNNNIVSIDDSSSVAADKINDNININLDESNIDSNASISPVQGNIWYVDSNVNVSGNGQSNSTAFKTLSEAITNSNDGDTIFIASGTYSGKENVGIYISKSLNLFGYGAEKPVFDAENSGNIFLISSDCFNMAELIFANSLSAHDSAVVLLGKGEYNLIRCGFYNNVKKSYFNSTGFKANGGALYAVGSQINLIECDFNGNNADFGGAAMLSGSFNNIIRCSFYNNTANLDGGALAVVGEGLTNIFGSQFISNVACIDAGAIYFKNYGETKLVDCLFGYNTARNNASTLYFNDFNIDGNLYFIKNCNFIVNSTDIPEIFPKIED